jgi:hypothetical protein
MMDEFSLYEYDTLHAFLPYMEQKIIPGFKTAITSNTLPDDLPGDPAKIAEFTQAVNDFGRNVELVKKNRPQALTRQQWDELLLIFHMAELSLTHNDMAQSVFGKQANKCYQILLTKRIELHSPPAPDGQIEDTGSSSDILDEKTHAALSSQRDKTFMRGMIAQVLAFLLIIAFIVIMLVDHQALLAYIILGLAALGIVYAVLNFSLVRKAGKRLERHNKAINRR